MDKRSKDALNVNIRILVESTYSIGTDIGL